MSDVAIVGANHNMTPVMKLEMMMKELIEIESGTAKKVEDLYDWRNSVDSRFDRIENETEVTTQQKNQIRRAVNRRVYELLNLPQKKCDWTIEDKIVSDKYSRLFHSRCYAESSKLGHLASPYESTSRKNYTDAIRDIEAWIPANGIIGLKTEADENAVARKIAREQGY